MGQVTYRLAGGLDEKQLAGIKGEALAILERIGVEVDHADIRKHLSDFDGVEIKGKRVCYSGAFVEEWIERIKVGNLEYSYNRKDDAFRLVGPYMSRWFIDANTGQQRYGTPEDLALSAQLMDVYDAYGPSPMHVQTVREELHQLVTFKTCVLNSREIGGWASPANAFDAEYLCRIGEAAGRKPPYGCQEIPISPLRLDHHALDVIFERRGRADQFTGLVYGGGAVPMPGASAPIHTPACLSQGLAEALAAYITPQLIDDRIHGYCSFGGFLFEMQTMNTGMFFPESLVYQALSRQVIQYVLGRTMGSHFRWGSFRNPGNIFCTGFEAALDALGGARTFLGAGGCEREDFDPALFVVSADIVRHVERFVRGIECAEDPELTLETVAHGAEHGMYLDHPSALDYRTLYLKPQLMFKCEDVETLYEEARRKVKEVLSEHRFELPADRRRDVEDVYASAVREIEKKGERFVKIKAWDPSRVDGNVLCAIWNDGVAPESEMYREMSADEFVERLAGRVGVPANVLVTAENAGKVAGSAVGCTKGLVEEADANLAALVVLPEHRGKGTGGLLLDAFEKQAKDAGCKSIQVSHASHVRFTFGVDPRTFGHPWLWRSGYSVRQSHLYMRMKLVGWTMPDATRAAIVRLREAGIDLRRAKRKDRPALVACGQEIRPRLADVFDRNARRRKPLPVLIAVRGDEVVGFVGPLWVTPCGIPDFELIAVLERERGKRIGSALFALAMESFAENGAKVMELLTGLDNPAQKIYFAAGFGCQHAFACFAKDLVA